MNGHEADADESTVWYQVRDEMTDQPKGSITADGKTRDMDDSTREVVKRAFDTDLIVQNDEVVAELGGVCYDGVCTITPADPGHNQMVLRNLGALTGLRPVRVEEPDDSGTDTRA